MKVLFTVFSASGNTLQGCAELFSERLTERGAECETVRIREDMAAPDVRGRRRPRHRLSRPRLQRASKRGGFRKGLARMRK